jgi:hypothetical protein
MPINTYSEVSSQSWFGRLGRSFSGILFGLLLILVAIGLLTWNEGRAVKRAKALKEGAGQVVEIAAAPVDAANEGRLVHLSGQADTKAQLTDPAFGVSGRFLKLRRQVEMYQWREQSRSETREKFGGGTETVTTYSYDKGWESGLIDSTRFKQPGGHSNPSRLPYEASTQVASPISLGDFQLSSSLIAEIDDEERLPLILSGEPGGSLTLPTGAQLSGNEVYLGANPSAPQVGDTRIWFSVVRPQTVSIISVQRGNSFEPYQASNGNQVELLELGQQSAQQMFAAAQDRNRFLTWGLRVAGFVLMFFGFRLLFGTLRIVAAVVPTLGRLVGGAIGLVAGLLALILSLITIAIAWVFYRPLLGVGLLVAALALSFGLKRARQGQGEDPATSSASTPAPAPPPSDHGTSTASRPPPPPPA